MNSTNASSHTPSDTSQPAKQKSGFVTILGRPSVGKSSLVNAICKRKISIVTPTPQTTRNAIQGIYSEQRGQIIFMDTPGIHTAPKSKQKKMNLRLHTLASQSMETADIVIYAIDSTRKPAEEEAKAASLVQTAQIPVIVLFTKCDTADTPLPTEHHTLVQPLAVLRTGRLHSRNPSEYRGIPQLLNTIFMHLPIAPPYYPYEHHTNRSMEFQIAESIREQAILCTRQELPHALFVNIADIEEKKRLLWARAFIFVEQKSQQGIVVGKNGTQITAIRQAAERQLASIFKRPVRLSIQVKLRSRWRRSDTILNALID